MVRASGYLFDHQIRYPSWEATNEKLQLWLEDFNIGGVILLGGSAGELSLRTQQLQNWSKIPLFIAADIEEGVGQRFSGATWFPPPMALGEIFQRQPHLALDFARQMGAITAQEAQTIGINWILAPVVDVNNNPDNPVINVRAFGESASVVSQLTTAFIEGVKPYPVLTTAKHFPGHGDTTTDSHLQLPRLSHPDSRLQELELLPFESAISASVDSIMTAHLLIQAWDPRYPATLSQAIVTGKLRQNLGFQGLIVSDALIMGGVTQFAPAAEIAVLAVEAGVDILLMPANPELAIEAIYQAVVSGRLTPERIQASLQRIWQAKQKLSLRVRNSLFSQFTKSQAQKIANLVVREAMVTGGSLPLDTNNCGQCRNLIYVDEILKADFLGHHTPAVAYPQSLGYFLELVDANSFLEIDTNTPLLLQIFSRGNPFRGSANLTLKSQNWIKRLLITAQVQGVAIYGSLYVAQWIEQQIATDIPWVFSYGQMPMAQAVVCKTLFGVSQESNLSKETFL